MSPPLRPQPPATPLATSDRAAASAIAAHRPLVRRVLTARSCVAHAPAPLAASSLPRCSCAACSRQLPRHSLRRLRSRSCAARRRAADSRATCSPPAAALLTLPRRLPPRCFCAACFSPASSHRRSRAAHAPAPLAAAPFPRCSRAARFPPPTALLASTRVGALVNCFHELSSTRARTSGASGSRPPPTLAIGRRALTRSSYPQIGGLCHARTLHPPIGRFHAICSTSATGHCA